MNWNFRNCLDWECNPYRNLFWGAVLMFGIWWLFNEFKKDREKMQGNKP